MESKTVYIYGLWDPRTMELRYIGKAKDLKDRLRNHIRLATDTRCENHHNYRWIRQLLNEGLKPAIEALEEVTEGAWQQAEQAWIAEARRVGLQLTNMTKGGDSFPDGYTPHNKGGTISEEHKSRLREANTGRPCREETKQKLRATNLGRKLSEEHKRKIGEKSLGKVMSPEARQKIGDGNRGKARSPELRQKLSEAHKSKKLSEEHKRKISEAGMGRTQTEETKEKLRKLRSGTPMSQEAKEKMAKAREGRKLSEEHKKNISEAAKRDWAKRKAQQGKQTKHQPLWKGVYE